MDYRASRRDPVQPSPSPARGKAASGPRGSALAGFAAGLDASPRIAQLKAYSGVVQRVVETDDLEAVKVRLAQKGVPAEAVDQYQALPNTYTEDEILLAYKGPNLKKPMQSSFPKLVRTGGENPVPETSLIFRGMSVNNVNNLQQSALTQDQTKVIFNAQNPEGQVSAVQHIVDDDPNSPFLSFEARGYHISGGKYAPKPIGPDGRKPRGVRREESGFLKQVPSYTGQTRNKYQDSSYVGYVGGLSPNGLDTLDVSTDELAQVLVDANAQRQESARRIAVNDREVLLKPGVGGVPRSQVPFVAKVKEVDKDYYEKKRNRQTSTKALGFFKPANAAASTKTRYLKAQIPEKYTQGFAFDIPQHHLKQNDDDSDISDVESIDLDMDDEDFSGGEEEQQEEAVEQVLEQPVVALDQQPVVALDQQPVVALGEQPVVVDEGLKSGDQL